MATNFRSQMRREMLHALQIQLRQECDELKAKATDSSKPVGKRHEAAAAYYLKSGELAMVNRKLKSAARSKKARQGSKTGSILGLLGIK